MDSFNADYAKLNTAQRKAVDTLDGPVMVIAGPGTGKTQVLALRIAHILQVTDTPPDGILCLTFTNAGVKAMRERLLHLIGPTATKVKISTFHAYGLELIEQYYDVLGCDTAPTLLDDAATVSLFNEVLYGQEWTYLRPRSNAALYYHDLKSLISQLKRDDITPQAFMDSVALEKDRISDDPDNISTRGETKGQLKKDAEKKLESLSRTAEAALFYAQYESVKASRNQIDYNDVLTYMVRIARESEDAVASIRERFLYVLIDEHQDSSGIQNAFLEAVWQDTDQPNLFVVGDDRQLIYGFGGASLAYFESFKHTFGTATLITLTQNYRSTQHILDVAEHLLTSALADGKLVGTMDSMHPLRLVECDYPRDEIIRAGLDIKEKVSNGIDINTCAILVPKNRHVKAAVTLLQHMGLPVAASSTLQLFELADTQTLLTVLRVVAAPHNAVHIGRSIVDPSSGIDPLTAHEYLYSVDTRKLSVTMLIDAVLPAIGTWGEQLSTWVTQSQTLDAYSMIQLVGDELLLKRSTDDAVLRRRVEIIRTLLHLALAHTEKGSAQTLANFIESIDQLLAYGEDIPLAVFGAQQGIKVLTLHGSKGLEFDAVWIAHMDERSLMAQKRGGFILPEAMALHAEEAAEDVAKRQLYVAITRAKRFCTISYARHSHAGADQSVASIITGLAPVLLITESAQITEDILLNTDATDYVGQTISDVQTLSLTELVAEMYTEHKVSVTTLNNFFECPWKWYFRNLLQLPEPLTESLHVGNVTHKTIEYILSKKNNDRSPSAITRQIAHCAAIEARYDDALARRLATHVQKIIDAWIVQYLPHITAPYDTEKSITYHDVDTPHLTITGKVDLIEEVITNEVRVTDWKTGTPKSSGEIDKSDESGRMSALLRQLTMYSYLIDGHSHGDTGVSESRLIFLEATARDKHAVHTRKITREDIDRLRKDIADYNALLKSGEWVHEPCRAKRYGSDEDCPYCKLAQSIYR